MRPLEECQRPSLSWHASASCSSASERAYNVLELTAHVHASSSINTFSLLAHFLGLLLPAPRVKMSWMTIIPSGGQLSADSA